jgi:hypothetical protein
MKETRMPKTLLIVIGVLVMATSLVDCECNTVVRDENVYRTELDFMEQTAVQPADKLVEWINLHCKCEEGKFIDPNAELCGKSAKLVQLIKARVPYHKAMMLWNADLLKTRPPKDPPEVPAPTELCPAP